MCLIAINNKRNAERKESDVGNIIVKKYMQKNLI